MKALSSVICVSLYTLHASTVVAAASPPIVDLGYAKYRGSIDYKSNITSYLGIRYAAPPLGDLRWRAPQHPVVEHELQDATVQPPACVQAGFGLVPTSPFKDNFAKLTPGLSVIPISGTEDCLFLNVFAPSETKSAAPLPVIVWIHGGGFALGDIATYPGRSVVHHGENGVVVVMMQYRMGAYGFLAGKEMKRQGALNPGLLDQEFAMKWVQDNISKFGGDPNQVTIWGESAGGGSVLQHLIAHDGKTTPPLYQRAIASSPCIVTQFKYDDPEAEMIYNIFLKRTNCSSSADTLACLRSADASVLASANSEIAATALYGTFVFLPVVDGEFITQSPVKAMQEKKVNPITAFLAVTTANEGAMFIDHRSDQEAVDYVQQLYPRVSQADAKKAAELYKGLGSVPEQRGAILGESILVCPSYHFLKGVGGSNAYKGTFAIPPALHGSDVPYYFTGLELGAGLDIPLPPPIFDNEPFKKAFVHPHLAIARFSDPNIRSKKANAEGDSGLRVQDEDMLGVQQAQQVFNPNITSTGAASVVADILPKWERFSPGNIEMWFDKTEDDQPDIRAVETDPALLERCRFWESIYTTIVQ